jgi:hypothetical protein
MRCPKCYLENFDDALECPCGHKFYIKVDEVDSSNIQEIERWNWGAFSLTWIWGIGNKTYVSFFMFVPFVNIVMPFILGAKGSRWAWENNDWKSIDHFRKIQKKWAIGGLAVFVFFVISFIIAFFVVINIVKNSPPYKIAYSTLLQNNEAISILGAPITAGLPSGSIKSNGSTGEANISFSVEGSNTKGILYMNASKDMGNWHINQLELDIEGKKERIKIK